MTLVNKQPWEKRKRWKSKPGAKQKHGEPTATLIARVPASLKDRLARHAKLRGASLTDALIEAVEVWLERRGS